MTNNQIAVTILLMTASLFLGNFLGNMELKNHDDKLFNFMIKKQGETMTKLLNTNEALIKCQERQ